jgi:D-alanyl-D-alanine-carboxypeptidase/D-alanyl-D-alanine-endopeptidase
MLLAEEGVINLDKPLHEYLARPLYEYPAYADLKGDGRYEQITARMVLSHSTGFPNWRFLEPDGRLKFVFSPGERHSYSGEGIALLQMVTEEVTGKDLETLAQEKVFQPLGMTRSSYIWQAAYEGNAASPHDEFGRPRGESIQRDKPDAAGSMVTTAGDYACFISLGILNVEGKRHATIDEMLWPQIAINYKNMFGPGAWQETDQYQDIRLAWGLGWGRFDTPYGRAFFHIGHSFGWRNYTVTYADKGIGIVLLSNSDNFESVAQEIVAKAIGDVYTPFAWLGYVPFDPSRPKTTPPPDPTIIEVDPAILEEYAGTYDMQPTALVQIKFEDNKLWILSMDGKSWNPLCAETETRFHVKGDEACRFEFIRDELGNVTALRMEYLGILFPAAPKMEVRAHQTVYCQLQT